MTTALVCGAGIGFGILLVVRGLFPPAFPWWWPSTCCTASIKAVAATAISAAPASGRSGSTDLSPLIRASPRPLSAELSPGWGALSPGTWSTSPSCPQESGPTSQSSGAPPNAICREKVALALVGLLLVPAFTGLLALGGTAVAWEVPLWAAVILAVGGFVLARPRHPHRGGQAQGRLPPCPRFLPGPRGHRPGRRGRRRGRPGRSGRGGAGLGLRPAASGPRRGRLTRTPPWGPLGRLGRELGIAELVELAAAVALAGAEGAKVRASLAAKAASIRSHALAEAQADAEAMSERMSLPVVVLFAGFLLFVGYPAMAHVLAGL